MADKKNDKKNKGGVAKWLLIPVLALAAYFLKDCIPGFGWGGAAGDGFAATSASADGSAAPSTSATTTPSASSSADNNAPISVTVKGNRCDGKDCKEACADALKKDGPVIVQASEGSHAVVEALVTCLKEGGRKVSIQAD